MSSERRWTDAQRLESWAGEIRINLIRFIAVLVFYAHHLTTFYFFQDDVSVTNRYHAWITILTVAWFAGVLAIHICLLRRWILDWLKYLATLGDLFLLTTLLLVKEDSSSMMAVLYFVLIAASAPRLSLLLVRLTTVATMLAYIGFQVAMRLWVKPAEELPLGRPDQVAFVLALGTAGLITGQMVRQAQRLVEGHSIIVEETEE